MAVVALAGLALLWPSLSLADSVNSPNITMNVDTNRSTGAGAGNVAVTINTITVAETNVNEYSSGATKAITLKVRPGFQFDTTSNVTAQSAGIGFNGGGVNVIATITPSGAGNEVLTLNLTSGTTAGQDVIRINGIKLKILNSAGAAGPAQATLLITSSTAGGAFTNQGIVAANITKGAPDHLAFSAQPGSTQAGADLLPAVKIVDFGENIITADARTITLAIQTNPGGGTLLGTLQHDTTNGIATWVDADDLRIANAGNGYTLRASHSGNNFLTSDTVTSGFFDIVAGAPDHLVITKQPVSTPAGADILIDVSVFDSMNNPVIAGVVNVTLDSAVNPGGWPLLAASGVVKPTFNGVASWIAADDLRINKAITDYKLSASGVGAPVITDAFNITPAAPSVLRFVQQPTDVAQNASISPPVSVEVDDAFLNKTDAAIAVDLALFTNPCGGAISGNMATSASGLAEFGSVRLDTACTGNELEATSAGLVSARSDLFNVAAVAQGNAAQPCGVCGSGAAMAVAPILLIAVARRRRNGRSRGQR